MESRLSHDRLDLALLASNEGVWDWSIQDDQFYYSDRALAFLGYSAENVPSISEEPERFLHPDDVKKYVSAVNGALKKNGDKMIAVDARYMRPDQTYRWLRIRGIVIRDEQQSAIRIVGSLIDISKRKNAEAALEAERHKLRALVENIPANIYYKDKESRFVLSNSATAKKLGVSSVKNLLGKTDRDFFDEKHANIARANELEIMTTLEPQIEVIQCETWYGKEDTWAETTKLPWLSQSGDILGTFGMTSDITKIVKAQQKLARIAEELRSKNKVVEEELQLAREIQQALLPKQLDKYSMSSHGRTLHLDFRYVPASALAGDFFEVIPISEHSIGLLICDVMGHGVRSSLIVSMLRGLMEKERHSAASPEWFLYGLNQGLVSILERSNITLFATALYCVIDLKQGTLEYASAGHPAPIVLKNSKAQQIQSALHSPNPPLGLIAETKFLSDCFCLDEISRILLFTDGIFEVKNSSDEELGEAAVLSLVEKSAGENLPTAIDLILDQARRHAEHCEFDDDVCLLAMDLKNLKGV